MVDAETWTPCCSIEEADRILTRTGSLLETETRIIGGRVLNVWKNLWPSLRLFFLHSTKKYADRTYIVYQTECYTFREILDKAVRCAVILRDVYGVKKGKDILLLFGALAPHLQYRGSSSHLLSKLSNLIVFWACHLLGAVTALVDTSQPLELLRYCIMLTRCALIVLDPERADMIEPVTAELSLASGASGCLVLENHEGQGHWEGVDVWNAVSSGYNRAEHRSLVFWEDYQSTATGCSQERMGKEVEERTIKFSSYTIR
ncbi:uncharacterized protein EV420DRAFT_1765972 [Desarmillaria tabescens]|uniref:AMP-dependent synthetase/ligase domain-containing protein n=1 Tax=Armillaria tabescens TaxID=1929756 RepID=A0AA39K1N5_ARMTA|nr:uncharacterized protein EV420DRAFT_1765972 [Desarmillaria tabescens]KAK0452875.1 hypothetical protein EV420DRAFT_1765972 [Desarmillaria tabescens]